MGGSADQGAVSLATFGDDTEGGEGEKTARGGFMAGKKKTRGRGGGIPGG